MKTNHIAWKFVCLLGVLLISLDVRAIPNTFGGFINPAGMRLEDFAARDVIWKPNAELKGNWELWKDARVTDSSIELLHLKMSAIVFGVSAKEVTVQRRDNSILQFQIVFKPGDKIKDLGKLKRVLKTNASQWSGSSASGIP